MNIVEGIDYIFDRYAFLNLDESAESETIRIEIRKRRAENHPDKLLKVSQEIKDVAAKQLLFIDDCEKVLMNEQLRPLYNEKLHHFKEVKPHLVSNNGVAKFDPTHFKIDIEYLLNTQILDLKELEDKAKSFTGFNEKKLEKAKQRFEKANKDDNEDEKLAYSEQLTNHLVYLNVLEDYYWNKAGVNGVKSKNAHRVQHTDEILEEFHSNINEIEEKTQHTITQHQSAYALGFAQPLLLTHSASSNATTEEQRYKLSLIVKENFKLRAKDVEALIILKKQVIDELLSLNFYKKLNHSEDETYYLYLTEDLESEEYDLLPIAFSFNAKTLELLPHTLEISHSSEIEKQAQTNVYVLQINKEIEHMLLQVIAFFEQIVS